MDQTDRALAHRWVPAAWGFICWWVSLFVFWLALVGKIELLELLAGAISATVAAIGALVVRQRDEPRFAVRPSQVWRVARGLPRKILVDCGRVASALLARLAGRPVEGRTREMPFDPGKRQDPEAVARRALVVAGYSLAPNSYVVDVDWSNRSLLVHDLVSIPETEPTDHEWPL